MRWPCAPSLVNNLLQTFMVVVVISITSLHGDEGVEEIELNVEKISALGNPDVLLSTISRLAFALNKCGVDVRGLKELQRVMLTSDNAKCMDGTPAGYYIRKKTGNHRWLVFLDGGYYCFDKRSCRMRSDNTPNLTSSMYWPLTRDGSGILSWNPEENPFMFSANIVYVPYCSSDAWSGTSAKNGQYFLGSHIVDEVIKDLLAKHGLKDGRKLFLAGKSAGATGVLLNVDKVADILAVEAPSVGVYGIVDSGWFLDTEQLHKTECTNTFNCPPAEAVKKGFRLWKPEIPKRCKKAYANEPWRCFFGYRIYPYIKSPLFVISYLYDRAQILASMGGGFGTFQQVQQDNYAKRNTEATTYMRELARFMNHTLSNVSAVFAPSCMDHEILLHNMWHSISIHGVSLVEALRCWEGSQETTNRPGQDLSSETWPSSNFDESEFDDLQFPDEERNNSIRHPNNKRDERRKSRIRTQKKRKRKRQRHQLTIRSASGEAESNDQILASALQSNSLKNYVSERQSMCQYRLFDNCSAPNCNMRCPNYLNLFSNSNSNSNSDNSRESNDYAYEADFSDIEDPARLEEIITRKR